MDIVEVREGEVIEPPLSIDEQLRLHCEWQEKDHTNGDYFHVLAKTALAELTALRKRVEELEGALEPLVFPHQYWMDEYPDGALCPLYNKVTWGDHRRARAALRAKGGE